MWRRFTCLVVRKHALQLDDYIVAGVLTYLEAAKRVQVTPLLSLRTWAKSRRPIPLVSFAQLRPRWIE
jgi:hypothetical protein